MSYLTPDTKQLIVGGCSFTVSILHDNMSFSKWRKDIERIARCQRLLDLLRGREPTLSYPPRPYYDESSDSYNVRTYNWDRDEYFEQQTRVSMLLSLLSEDMDPSNPKCDYSRLSRMNDPKTIWDSLCAQYGYSATG